MYLKALAISAPLCCHLQYPSSTPLSEWLLKHWCANFGIFLDVFEFCVLDDFFRSSKKSFFWVFLVHPTVVSVLLSASVERCFVSRMRDFLKLRLNFWNMAEISIDGWILITGKYYLWVNINYGQIKYGWIWIIGKYKLWWIWTLVEYELLVNMYFWWTFFFGGGADK